MSYLEAHNAVAKLVESWRAKRYPYNKSEIVTCPACAGRLRLTQNCMYATASKVQAHCDSAFCVNYSE